MDIWGELPQDCANWNFLEDHPEVLNCSWLKLSPRAQEELRKLWRTRACKILDWSSLSASLREYRKGHLYEWPDTHVQTNQRLAQLKQAMKENPALRLMIANQEIVAFQVDWTRFTADEMAEEIARQFKAVFTRPEGQVPPLSQKPIDPAVSLRNLAIARLRKALQPALPSSAASKLKTWASIDQQIKAMAKAAGYALLAQSTTAVFRNHRRDVQRTFLRLHPYLRANQAAGLVEDEIPDCLQENRIPTPPEK